MRVSAGIEKKAAFLLFPAEASTAESSGTVSFVIFGVWGDLARKKTLPSIFRLWAQARRGIPLEALPSLFGQNFE